MTGKSKRILMFDEDFETMFALKEYLEEECKWQVELTAGREILDRLGRERFDLLLVDCMIHPQSLDAGGNIVENVHFDGVNWRKTGLEFVRRLRRGDYSHEMGVGTSPDVPVITLSAVARDSAEGDFEEPIPIQDYVEKPFRLEEILKRIRELLQE